MIAGVISSNVWYPSALEVAGAPLCRMLNKGRSKQHVMEIAFSWYELLRAVV